MAGEGGGLAEGSWSSLEEGQKRCGEARLHYCGVMCLIRGRSTNCGTTYSKIEPSRVGKVVLS